MAIDNFKKIENNKGYLVEDKDRKIFEREISKGYFGMNIGDTIEFVLYDSNDNPLPQESAKGKSVRYIEYNDNTKKDYFGKTLTDSQEFFIDTEKLIKEAGYTNGIFKSQVSLLNRRLGSGDSEFDKLWIHEISPSRTEIRILPTVDETGVPNNDLSHRYELFVDDKTFLPDVYPFIDEFIQLFDVQKVLESMLTSKGKVEEGQNYIKLIESEFKISNFETYLKKVQDKFIEAANHFKGGREYNILSNNYGQPKGIQPSLNGDINNIYNIMVEIAGQCVEFFLPKRDVRYESSLTIEQQKTLDDLEQLQKTQVGDSLYESTIPSSISAKSVGCKNPDALNYNPDVDVHDESLCEFVTNLNICNDPNAVNYGEVGSCIYRIPPPPKPKEVVLDIQTPEEIIQERVDMQRDAESLLGLDPLGGQKFDLTNPREAALVQVVTDTFNQVNERALEIRREEAKDFLPPEPLDLNTAGTINISAKQFDNMSKSDKLVVASKPSVVLDGKIKDRVIREI